MVRLFRNNETKVVIYLVLKISREEEAKLPAFDSHEAARGYFKERYGDDFIFIGSEKIMEEKCFFYYILLNRDAFVEGTRKIQAGIHDASLKYLESHQPVQIMESGSVHIVH